MNIKKLGRDVDAVRREGDSTSWKIRSGQNTRNMDSMNDFEHGCIRQSPDRTPYLCAPWERTAVSTRVRRA
ncbi:MAG: hypothetical protein ACKOAX_04015, partial [Candidatus Kapaibacterium sp.]